MSFTVEDFQDLLRLLDQHPEWRAELRRHVLSDELVELPALVRQLAEAQARTEARLETLTARVDALAEAQARTEARLEALTTRVEALTARVDALVEQVAALTGRMDELVSSVQMLKGEVGTIKGWALETRYRSHAPGYFGRIARRVQVVDLAAFVGQLDTAVEEHVLTEPEREALLVADIVLTGQRHEDQKEVYLLVEVSGGIGPYDVQRAADRAVVLAKLGRPAVLVVAGEWINPDGARLARERGVWQVLDGQIVPPRRE